MSNPSPKTPTTENNESNADAGHRQETESAIAHGLDTLPDGPLRGLLTFLVTTVQKQGAEIASLRQRSDQDDIEHAALVQELSETRDELVLLRDDVGDLQQILDVFGDKEGESPAFCKLAPKGDAIIQWLAGVKKPSLVADQFEESPQHSQGPNGGKVCAHPFFSSGTISTAPYGYAQNSRQVLNRLDLTWTLEQPKPELNSSPAPLRNVRDDRSDVSPRFKGLKRRRAAYPKSDRDDQAEEEGNGDFEDVDGGSEEILAAMVAAVDCSRKHVRRTDTRQG